MWDTRTCEINIRVAQSHWLRWPTQFSCVLLLMQFSACTMIAKQTCRWYSDHFVRSVHTLSLLFFDGFSLLQQRYVRKGNDARNPTILEFFQIERTQLNAAHAQLLEKLRPVGFAQTCRFLTIQSLEFKEIWQKIVHQPLEWSVTKNLNF